LKFKLVAFVFIVLFVAAFFLPGCEMDDDVINLQFATFWPEHDFQVAEGHMKWIEEIEERVAEETEVEININMQAGEVVLGADEIYEGVSRGSVDIGTTCPSYTPGVFPLSEAFEIPGYENKNALVASKAVNEGMKRFNEELGVDEYEDVKVMFFWATGPGDVMSQSPVETMEDLDGKEMRITGGPALGMGKLGATTVGMPMSEAYESLDHGAVDSILAPNDTLKGFNLAEVLDYVTKTPFLYNLVFTKVMNIETWESLPEDVQEIFEEVNEEFVKEYGELRTEFTRQGLEHGVEEHDIEVIELDEEEEERWIEAIEPAIEEWIADVEEKDLPGEEAVEIVEEMFNKYAEEYGDF